MMIITDIEELKNNFKYKAVVDNIPETHRFLYIEYGGSGDSGCIESIKAVRKEAITCDLKNEIFEIDTKKADFLDIDSKVKDIIEDIILENILENLEDWWNNDGGGGSLLLNVDTKEYWCSHYINILSTRESFHHGTL